MAIDEGTVAEADPHVYTFPLVTGKDKTRRTVTNEGSICIDAASIITNVRFCKTLIDVNTFVTVIRQFITIKARTFKRSFNVVTSSMMADGGRFCTLINIKTVAVILR